jgi:hypothetical protein
VGKTDLPFVFHYTGKNFGVVPDTLGEKLKNSTDITTETRRNKYKHISADDSVDSR